MPLPWLLIGGIAAGAAGIFKGGEAILNNHEAKELLDKAERKYKRAARQLEEQRGKVSQDLDELGEVKLESWAMNIGEFIKLFKLFKKVDIQGDINLNEKLKMQIDNPQNLKKMEIAALKASEVIQAGVSSLGAGALAGIASYGGTMMFASASTGTAITALSGAAAKSATLAWLGGGSIATGGLGVAGGTLALGGIVAGPALAVAGFIMAAKSEENLANAEENYSEAMLAVEKIETMTDFLSEVSNISSNYKTFIVNFSEKYQMVLDGLKQTYSEALEAQKGQFLNRVRKVFGLSIKVDYTLLSEQQQKTLHLSWLMTQILYATLTAPLLTSDGQMDQNAYVTLSDAQKSLKMLKSGT